MKTLLSISLALLFITSCGSSSKKTYTLKDDNNGTRSPRVKEIITKTADNNKSEETITRYTYNEENLLISEKTSYTQKRPKNEGSQDIQEVSYTYTKHKQVETMSHRYFDLFNRAGSYSEYIYSDIISQKTKLPVIDNIKTRSRAGTCVYEHSYILDNTNFAISLDKINKTCDLIYGNSPHIENSDYHADTDFLVDEYKIYNKNLSKHTEQYTYFSQSAIATYNKGLRESVEYYSPDETNASKEPTLTNISEYVYENKPYFSKEYLSPMVSFLPH